MTCDLRTIVGMSSMKKTWQFWLVHSIIFNSWELANPIPGNSAIGNDRESRALGKREPRNECPKYFVMKVERKTSMLSEV